MQAQANYQQALAVGFQMHIAKPVPATLLATIIELTERHTSSQEHYSSISLCH